MKTAIYSIFEKALNRYLSLDPESKSRIHVLENHVVSLELLKLGITLHMVFIDGTIQFKEEPMLQPDVRIKGTPLSLLHMGLTKGNRHSFFTDDVTIEGNLEIGQQIIDLFDQLEIDWEEYFSHWIGDIPAHQIGRFVSGLKNFRNRVNETLLQNVNEYVHEEIAMFPPNEALKDFFHQIDILRMDTDRMEARIKQLAQELK